MNDLLEQGIIAYQAGKRDEARNFLIAFTKQSPDDERAWEWMSKVTNNEQERNYCLQQIARINPKSVELNTPNTQQSSSAQLPPQNIKPVSLITLTCPSCGGKLQITNDIERFSCGHCGNEHIVQRSGNAISLAPVMEGLKEVKVSVDKTVSELAIKRLPQEIEELKKEIFNVQIQPSRRQFAEVKVHREKSGLSYVFLILIGLCIFFGSVSISDNTGIFIIFGLIAGGSVFALGLYFLEQSSKYEPKISFTPEENEKIQQLQDVLDKKIADLERHRNIVDS